MVREQSNYLIQRKKHFKSILASFMKQQQIDPGSLDLLIVGASTSDEQVLFDLGFTRIVSSNLDHAFRDGEVVQRDVVIAAFDAENLGVRDDSHDLVLAYEVMHHCRSPHRALCELLRASRRFVVFVEPNDSLAMRLMTRLKLSFPYELPAVIDREGHGGGVRNSGIPNFIYRWSGHETMKVVSAFLPEYNCQVFPYSYWDFTLSEHEIELRSATRIPVLARIMGPSNLIWCLKRLERVLNWLRPIRMQGNKFCCIVQKTDELKPWLTSAEARITLRKD